MGVKKLRAKRLWTLFLVCAVLSASGCGSGAVDTAEIEDAGAASEDSGQDAENKDAGIPQESQALTMEGIIFAPLSEDGEFQVLADDAEFDIDFTTFEAGDAVGDQELLYGDHVRVVYEEQKTGVMKTLELEMLNPVYEIKTVEGVLKKKDTLGPSLELFEESTGKKFIITSDKAIKIALDPEEDTEKDTYCTFLEERERVRVEYIETDDEIFPLCARKIEQMNDLWEGESTVLEGVVEKSNGMDYNLVADDGTWIEVLDINHKVFELVPDEKTREKMQEPGTRLRLEYRGCTAPIEENNTARQSLLGRQVIAIEIVE